MSPTRHANRSDSSDRCHWKGVFVGLVTPFQEDERIDFKSLDALLEFELASGVAGLVVGAPSGETEKLSAEERRKVAEAALRRAEGRVPVLVGVSAASNFLTIEHARHAKDHGAAGILAAPPMGAAFVESQVQIFFDELDAAVGLPVIARDTLPQLPLSLPPHVLANLFPEVASVVAVQVESPPTATKMGALTRLEPGLALFSGLDGAFFVEELDRGARGVVCGPAFPGNFQQIMSAFANGDLEGARREHGRISEVIRFMTQSHEFTHHCAKRLLKMRGVLDCAAVRRPTAPFDERNERDLTRIAVEAGLLPRSH